MMDRSVQEYGKLQHAAWIQKKVGHMDGFKSIFDVCAPNRIARTICEIAASATCT